MTNTYLHNVTASIGEPPLHVAILPDGGRRWARSKGVSLSESYEQSVVHLGNIVKALFDERCDRISVFVSGYNNHKLRTQEEVKAMNTGIRLLLDHCEGYLCPKIGSDIEIFAPDEIAREADIPSRREVSFSLENQVRVLALFVGYSPLLETHDAIRRCLAHGQDTQNFQEHLWARRPVDVLVRTGGYNLTSGFLPFATGYSRLYFLDSLFNDTKADTFTSIISEYLRVPRLYGV